MQRSTRSAAVSAADRVGMNTRSKRQRSVSTPKRSQSSKRTAKRGANQETINAPASPLTSLPFDAVATILSCLTARDVLQCMQVNRWWKQQVYTSSHQSLKNTVFKWTPSRKLQRKAKRRSNRNAQRHSISLPHVRRLLAVLPSAKHGNGKTVAESCQTSLQFILDDIHQHCQHLVELQVSDKSATTTVPSQLQGQAADLQKLYLYQIGVSAASITTIATAYPSLTSLKMLSSEQGMAYVPTTDLCQAIGQSLPLLEALVLPISRYTDADIAALAPSNRLRHLRVRDYGDVTFTFQQAWRLESLRMTVCPPQQHGAGPFSMIFKGSISTLVTLSINLDATEGADNLLESLIATGVSSSLQYFSLWGTQPRSCTKTADRFSQFKMLRGLQFAARGIQMDLILICGIIRKLQCSLHRLDLPWWNHATVDEIHTLYKALAEAPAVRECQTLSIPYVAGVDDSVWKQLMDNLQSLLIVHIPPLSDRKNSAVSDHLMQLADDYVEVDQYEPSSTEIFIYTEAYHAYEMCDIEDGACLGH